MDTTLLETKFHRLGARMKFVPRDRGSIRIDIRSDRRGEFFELAGDGATEVSVLDLQPQARHLLLMSRDGAAKHKYLCGHDERHWFVAGIPETAPVGTVRQAMDALKPPEVRVALARLGVRPDEGNRRKNAAFLRQGEWFFVPAPDLMVDPRLVLQREPLRRGNGKPHWAEFAYRTAGELVYVCRQFPNGVSQSRYQSLCSSRPGAKSWNWRPMRRNALVYVRGRVRHADHATILLPGWHRVLMNTEGQSQAMRNVAFLD